MDPERRGHGAQAALASFAVLGRWKNIRPVFIQHFTANGQKSRDVECRAEEAACDAAEEQDNSVVVKAVLFIGSVAFGAWVLTEIH